MDETGVMLSVKRTMVTAIECISANDQLGVAQATYETLEALEFCFENNIILCRLPSHTSHKLQPYDVGVFVSLKEAYRDEADRLFRGGANTVGKQHFTSLYSPDAHTLNETSIQRIERHVQKLANAAQISFAERALLHDQNQMLTRMNNEAKVRRSTRSIVLGKAKVISFKDIEVARAARAAKEVIKGKGKRGRKRKSTAVEAEESEADEPEPEPEPEVACAAKEVINGRGKRSRKRKSVVQEAEEPEPEVARMTDIPVP
ncbi:hypothetical protein G7Y89_g6442 [Cudoniella acicularis]|uniref:DDE-1 domain-containing protein n=1 Tax=Cudoniella acicularis TaxID=354080 RepID=A0A8H4W304_9HELO|nr:hypothetical protein G7Y89_g6442 [Cudoniella acicularis]